MAGLEPCPEPVNDPFRDPGKVRNIATTVDQAEPENEDVNLRCI